MHLIRFSIRISIALVLFVLLPVCSAQDQASGAGQWADLFVKAGARFAGPVAEHHDGFAMCDSKATPWNSMDMRPGRDATGELEKAIRARGLKFMTSFHHARNLQRYKGKEEEILTREKNINYQFRNSHYPLYPGTPPTLDDPELNYLYGSIPEDQQHVLLEIGAWLEHYGEDIYGTRPWYTFGEGPTAEPESERPGDFQQVSYTSEDVRYTTSGNTVYAIFLGKPVAGESVVLEAFSPDKAGQTFQIQEVSIPGESPLPYWEMLKEGLKIRIPRSGLDEKATVLKISCR